MKITSVKAPDLAMVDTAVTAVLFRSDLDVLMVDARGADAEELIPNAVALEPDCSEQEADDAIGAKNRVVITYCTNIHCPLGMRLMQHLREMGYENLLEYPDGIGGWKAAGYPVTKANES